MPSVSALLKSVQHPTRRQILNKLSESPSSIQYSELLYFTEQSTGKLNYHLRALNDIIIKSETEVGYILTPKGRNIVKWLNNLVSEGDPIETDRPSVVFNRIFPAKSLFYKFATVYSVFMALFIGPVIFLGILLSTPYFMISFLIILLLGIDMKTENYFKLSFRYAFSRNITLKRRIPAKSMQEWRWSKVNGTAFN